MGNTFEKYMAIAEEEMTSAESDAETIARVAKELDGDETTVNYFLLETARKNGTSIEEAAMDFDVSDYAAFEKAWKAGVDWAKTNFGKTADMPDSLIGSTLGDFAVDNDVDMVDIRAVSGEKFDELEDYFTYASEQHERGVASRA